MNELVQSKGVIVWEMGHVWDGLENSHFGVFKAWLSISLLMSQSCQGISNSYVLQHDMT